MKIEQIYTKCLSQGAYYIESNGEVAIIDPLRDVSPYFERAESDNATIKYIFETHFHADFVSGHLDIAKQTGASIVYGPLANPSFNAIIAKDTQVFKLGNISITVLHTPGHTMESTTYLLKDEEGNDYAIFTGDTLFLGDVGRPDLAQKSNELTKEDLASHLYDSLRNKIMPLNDDVIVYPAHGAGSACGKSMMKETVDTLGNQKKVNYALRADMTKQEFINEVLDGLQEPPKYFPQNVKLNKEGYLDIAEVLKEGTKDLTVQEFEAILKTVNPIVLDVRDQNDFKKGHIPNSIFIGIDGGFAPWVGELLADVNQPILLVADKGREEETVLRLSRVGFDNTLGYLNGGFSSWKDSGKEVSTIKTISAKELKELQKNNAVKVFDVRKDSEYNASHLSEVSHTSLSNLESYFNAFPKQDSFYMYCAGGYRSVIAASILKRNGIHNGIDISGGFNSIKEEGLPITDFVCPSTLK